MYFFAISLYEFGQFLRILLWIFLPMVMLTMLITTWMHYRRRRGGEAMIFSVEGYGASLEGSREPEPAVPAGRTSQTSGAGAVDEKEEGSDTANENMYRGILWMKEKYERFRELSDQRCDQLKEELHRSEKKYQDLLASIEESRTATPLAGQVAVPGDQAPMPVLGEAGGSEAGRSEVGPSGQTPDAEKESLRDLIEEKNRQITYLQGQLDQRILHYHQSEQQGKENKDRADVLEEKHNDIRQTLEERQRTIDELEERLRQERQRSEELIAKLQENSNLLLSIHKELDRTLHPENG